MTANAQGALGPGADAAAAPSLVDIVSADGARSQARLFVPAEGAPRAVAVCLPAMGVEARYYDPFARALAARGVAALTAELRGNGSSSLRAARRVDFGYRELVELDLTGAVAAARERVPGPPVRLVGHSLGGHLSILFAALRPREVDGIALIAAGSPYFRAHSGRARAYVLLGALALRGLSAALGYLPGRAVGFGGREARRLIAEWARLGWTGRFAFAGAPPDLADRMAAASLPVLALSFGEDRYAPAAAVDHMAGMLPGAALTRRHTAPGELGDGVDHFRWVRRPDGVADIVVDWMMRG
ncbi:MAG TPA: alpha/beta fold hydrolase [Kofleriaceae bacterium]|nr:alpha/beta fold hydrolase [Kofleriaceae bacterium]